jgi:hypothetical protein
LEGVFAGSAESIIIGRDMAKAELKTRPTDASVEEFLNSVADEVRRRDAFRVLEMFKAATGEEPKMWGPAIVGFGSQVIKYADGRELDWPVVGFSPRKVNMTLYVVCRSPNQASLLEKLGPHKTSVSCLYIKRLSDIDEKTLQKLIKDAAQHVKKKASDQRTISPRG